MIDMSVVGEMLAAAQRSGLDDGVVQEIEEIVRVARVEEQLKVATPDRLIEIVAAAEQVLGREGARKWLRRANRALGAVPLDLVGRGEEGAARVRQVLGRMEHGVFS